jgi:CRISPR-associated endonuclease Csn1
VAIYRDGKGNLQEEVVSFYDAVVREFRTQALSIKNHSNGWEFLFSMNKMSFLYFHQRVLILNDGFY